MVQTVPQVSRDDVVRVVRRDYPTVPAEQVLAILDAYGAGTSERGRDRVHLAVLKLAAGDLEELRRQVDAAKRDFRDALAEAEFPEALAHWAPGPRRSPAEEAATDERDRAQYERWLAQP